MATTKWFLTNVEDEEDRLNFIGHPSEFEGMHKYFLKEKGKKERLVIEYQGKRYNAKVLPLTQHDDVPCNHGGCLRSKSDPSECRCQCAGRHHGDFWKLLLDEDNE